MLISCAIVGDEVVRVETMKVGGEKIVRTEEGSDAAAARITKGSEERAGSASRRMHPVCGVPEKIQKTCRDRRTAPRPPRPCRHRIFLSRRVGRVT